MSNRAWVCALMSLVAVYLAYLAGTLPSVGWSTGLVLVAGCLGAGAVLLAEEEEE